MNKKQQVAIDAIADEIYPRIMELQDIYWDGSDISDGEMTEAVALSLIRRHSHWTHRRHSRG